ncbi:TPA: hypothetical protein ACS72F_000380 [Providencia alcalifaciens]
MGKQLTTNAKFARELNERDLKEYERAYDLFRKIEMKVDFLDEKDSFRFFMKNSKDGKLPEIPLFIYSEGLNVPRKAPNEILARISSLLKNDIRLPKALMDYLCSALDSVTQDNLDIKKAFLFSSTYRKDTKDRVEIFKYTVEYIRNRIAILYTFGIDWKDIIDGKNKMKAKFYEEISDELNFKYKLNKYSESEIDKELPFNISKENIRKIIFENHIYDVMMYIMPTLIPSNYTMKYIEDYKLYLEYKSKQRYNSRPISKDDAKKRIQELDLLLKYFKLSEEELPKDKTFDSWRKNERD